MSWVENEFKDIDFGDKRLNKRFLKTASFLSENPAGTINQSFKESAPKKGAYRLLSNKKYDPNLVMQKHANKTKERMKEHKVVLSLHDTTYLSYTNKKSIKGLGNIGGKRKEGEEYEGDGFIFHGGLALTPKGVPLGIQSFITWSRGEELPWDKESERWQDSFFEAKESYSDDCQMVYVADREADQYQLMKTIIDDGKDFVIRSGHDRLIHGKNHYLNWEIERSKKPERGTYYCQKTQKNIDVELRYGNFSFNDPQVIGAKQLKRHDIDYLELNYVEVRLIRKPSKRWVLLTTLDVSTGEDALKVMSYYRHRWQIEEYFKVLKGGGCKVEMACLRKFERLVNFLSMIAVISWRIHHLQQLSRQNPQELAKEHLSLSELEAIGLDHSKILTADIFKWKLKDVIRYIARMGGFNIRKGKEPGLNTLYKGMCKLDAKADTFDDMKVSLGIEKNQRLTIS